MTHALDLFAGAGGWDVAAQSLGIHADGVEIMPAAVATREAAGLSTVHDDVWTMPLALLALYVLLITSPPCQTFSAAGKGSGRQALDAVLRLIPHVGDWSRSRLRKVGQRATGDDRTALVLAPLWYALNMPNVRSLAWEQVPAVLPVWEACAEVLRAQGWHVWTGCLQAEQYGVPQTRRRAFLIASRDHEVRMPTPTHSRYYARDPKRLDPGVLPWVSMAEGIAKLARYTDRPDWLPRYMSGAGSSSTVQRPRPVTEPAHTVTGVGSAEWHDRAEPAAESGQRARDAIRLEPCEAGILQSFPADFPWQGNKGRQYLQAGNAVPPGVARAVLAEAAGINLPERGPVDLLDLLAESAA